MIFMRVMKLWVISLAFLAVVTGGANLEGAASPTLPLWVPEAAWRPLEQREDRRLQAKLDQALRQGKLWRELIDQGKMAVGLVDLQDPESPRFAQVNGDTMMYAASLPKIAILLAIPGKGASHPKTTPLPGIIKTVTPL